MIAIYPGTFDPITLGHEEIIFRASRLFDYLIIGVAQNNIKHSNLHLDHRLALVNLASKDFPNVSFESYQGLTINFAKAKKAQVIVRGVRNTSDFNYESQMAGMNNIMDKEVETLLLVSSDSVKSISSTIVRQILSLDGDTSKFLSSEVNNYLKNIK